MTPMPEQETTELRKSRSSKLLINISIIVNVFTLVSYVFVHDIRLLALAIPGTIYLAKNKAATKDEKERRTWVQIKSGTFFLILPAGLILIFILYFLIRVIFPEIMKNLNF
jgi:hypothetical protein